MLGVRREDTVASHLTDRHDWFQSLHLTPGNKAKQIIIFQSYLPKMQNCSFNTYSYESYFVIQETFDKQRVCVHRATAAHFHRYSTMGACFSTCFIGSVSGGQGTCSGGPSTKRLQYHRDWSSQLFSGHARSFNQDNTTVGRLTSENIDKAGNDKKTDVKQHKQVVSTHLFFYQCLNNIDQYPLFRSRGLLL